MIAVIDTSSLLALVKYYLPFDKRGELKDLIQQKYESGELLLLDAVADEAKYIAGRIIFTELPFLEAKDGHSKTTNLLPNRSFFNMMENQFCNQATKRLKGITETEFEIEKQKFLNSADGKILLYGVLNKSDDLLIVTEESNNDNDNKIFKKIPENCRTTNLTCCNLPTLLKDHFNINLATLFQ